MPGYCLWNNQRSIHRRLNPDKNKARKLAGFLLFKFDKLTNYGKLNREEKENHPARWQSTEEITSTI